MAFDAKDFLPPENGLADNGQPWEHDPLDDWEGPAAPDEFYSRPELSGLIFATPPEGIETVLMLLPERLPAPFFVRLRPCLVRVVYEDDREDQRTPSVERDGVRIPYQVALGWGY